MIVDSFTFFNEFDLLDFRLKLLYDKVESYAHQEYNNTEFRNPERIRQCIEEGKDLFARGDNFVTVSPDIFPPDFLALAKEQEQFFFQKK